MILIVTKSTTDWCVTEVQGITFPCDKDRVISVWTKKVLRSPLPFTLMIPRQEHI